MSNRYPEYLREYERLIHGGRTNSNSSSGRRPVSFMPPTRVVPAGHTTTPTAVSIPAGQMMAIRGDVHLPRVVRYRDNDAYEMKIRAYARAYSAGISAWMPAPEPEIKKEESNEYGEVHP